MTEKQGGSDLRTTTTTASPTDTHGEYLLTGHKWFTSAPMNDVFLVLAQAPDGVTCFVVPRVLPDGSRNALQIVRLKDKLGNRSNASSEIELNDAMGTRLGDEGRGIRTIIEMVSATRMDCILGSSEHHAQGRGRGVLPCLAPIRVRRHARRPAGDDQRLGRPRRRDRGGHHAGASARCRRRRAE